MTAFNHAAFFAAARPLFGGKLTQAQVDGLNGALSMGFGVRSLAPAWFTAGIAKIGESEVPGPKHNAWIVGDMWKKLGAGWLKTDDKDGPWCGGFMAWCMNEAGIVYPKEFPRALAWADWGVECEPQLGAVCVMERPGGGTGHVTMAAGKTKAGDIKGLGGNQRNQVNIDDFPFSRITDWRWPAGVPILNIPLPVMAPGTISRNEA